MCFIADCKEDGERKPLGRVYSIFEICCKQYTIRFVYIFTLQALFKNNNLFLGNAILKKSAVS